MKKSSTLKELEKKIEETKAKNLEEFKQAELQSLKAWSEQLRELLVSELNTTKNDINEVLRETREQMQMIKKEQMQTSKKHWIVPTLIAMAIIAGIILLMKSKQPNKIDPILKIWQDGIELKKGYKAEIMRTKEGTIFIKTDKE